jgi:RNA polymerase sigma factor (sigma-70 family)
MLHHHDRHYVAAVEAERRARAARRRPQADAGELEAMVLAAARGDAAGWSALMERFTARIRGVASLHRLPPADVDDVVQTTWLRLLEHIDSVREPSAVGAWLETTARRESLRVIGRARRELPTEGPLRDEEVAEPVAERLVVEAERRTALASSVERLSPAQQRLIRAVLAHPTLGYAELADTLGRPIGSIGPTRARSLAQLRRDPALASVVGQAV